MCSIDVRVFHLTRRSNRVFYEKRQLVATVDHKKDITSNIDDVQRFIRRKYRIWIKKTFTLAPGQNFIENVCSDSRIVLCILNTHSAIPEKIGRIANVFAKVSFGNRRWNKNSIECFATYTKSTKSYHLDLKLHIKFTAFSYFCYTLFFVGCFADIVKNYVTASACLILQK